ncbi:MAG: LysR substrate-binding domain-containing protein [bacterium]|nr:LysR substrate-binding domain-containing protein [bacterium]MDT8396523.1 LysR substrate-binding domain-containing protein [bacterium]
MDVNLSSLRTFLIVAKFRGISRALGELHLTQPAVSRQIQGLEEYLGTQLFLRKGRFLVLTEAGQILQQYTTRVLQLLTEAREEIDSLKGLIRGHLRIAAATTVGIYMIPDVLGEFKSEHPGIEITLTIANKEEILRQVKDGVVDIGFAGQPIPHKELVTESYLEDDMVLVVSPQHPFAVMNTISTAELAEEVFILRERGSGTREIIEEELRRAGVTLKNTMELGSTEGIKKAVAANLGVSIVSSRAVTLEVMIGHLSAVWVSDLNLRHSIHMLYLRNDPRSSAVEGFRRFLSDRLAGGEGAADLPALPERDTTDLY